MHKLLFIFLFSVTFSYAQNYSVESIDKKLLNNANIVIRNKNTDIIIHSIDDMEYHINSVKTIFTKDFQRLVVPYISYDKGDRVSKVEVVLYDKFGRKIKKFSKSDFKDYANNSESTFYSDSRMLILPFVPTEYPYTISFSYTYRTKNTVFISDFTPVRHKGVSVEKSKLNIQNESGIKLKSKIYKSPFNYTSVLTNGENAFSYESVPAIVKEPLLPALKYFLPRVSFSLEKFNLEGKRGKISSWQDFGKWYYQSIMKPVEESTPEIKSEIVSLNLSGTTEEKVKKIYQFMQGKTRYVSVALGIGGWQPMLPKEVQKKGYGDCKGLTNYMKTLLDEAGITSYYAIVNSGSTPIRFDEKFPKMGGNHVILMVPTEKGTIWLENTSQLCAFNHLTINTTNRNALAIKPDGIEIVNTPVYDASMNQEIQNFNVKMNEDLSINAKGKITYTGSQYDYNLGLVNLKKEDKISVLRNRFDMMNFDNLDVQNLNNDRDIAALSFNMDFKSSNYSKRLGNSILFRAVPVYSNSFYHEDKDRLLPFEIGHSYQDEYVIKFEFPAGYQVDEISDNVTLSSEFGTYHLTFSQKENQLIVKRFLMIKKGIFPKEKYNDYVKFRNTILKADNSKILIKKP